MKKPAIPSLFALVLVALVIGILALTSDGGNTGHSGAKGGYSVKLPKIGNVKLPQTQPVATTTPTTAVATTTTTLDTIKTVTPVTSQLKVVSATTTVPIVAKTVVPTTVVTTVPPPTANSSVTFQTVTTGVMTAPDKTECSAGADQECVLVTTIPVNANPPSFVITDTSGTVVGVFTANDESQPYCLIHWLVRSSGAVASSSDCSGGPLMSDQTAIDFTYSSHPN